MEAMISFQRVDYLCKQLFNLQPLNALAPQVCQLFTGRVTCFKTNSIECTLLARHDKGYADPWLILTDLPPEDTNACWYAYQHRSAQHSNLVRIPRRKQGDKVGSCLWLYIDLQE